MSDDAAPALPPVHDESDHGLVRPVGPIDAPAIGDPPVALFAIHEASRAAREDEEPLAAVRRLHPTLSEREAKAGLEVAVSGDMHLRPAPWRPCFALGITGLVGSFFVLVGLIGSLGGLAIYVLRTLTAPEGLSRDPFAGQIVFSIVLCAALFLPAGVGLLRRELWGLVLALATFAAIAILTVLASFAMGQVPIGLVIVVPFALAVAASYRWFSPEGRAAASVLGTNAVEAAAGWSIGLLLSLRVVVPSFKRVFEETGTRLPFLSERLLNVSDFVASYWYIIVFPGGIALLFLGPFAHRLEPRHDRLLTRVIHLGGLVLGANILAGVMLPMLQLVQKL